MTWKPKGKTEFSDDVVVEAGWVGIGTSSPGAILDVSSGNGQFPNAIRILSSTHATSRRAGISLGDSTSARWIAGADAVGDGTDTFFLFDATSSVNTERLRIDSAGLIIGTGTSLGAWTPYTPTLGGEGWVLRNGTAAGQYCQIGKMIHFWSRITFGTTSIYGGGAATVSLPVAAKSIAYWPAAEAIAFDSSLSKLFMLKPWQSNTTTLSLFRLSASTGELAGTDTNNPFVWASSDQIVLSGTYEAA